MVRLYDVRLYEVKSCRKHYYYISRCDSSRIASPLEPPLHLSVGPHLESTNIWTLSSQECLCIRELVQGETL